MQHSRTPSSLDVLLRQRIPADLSGFTKERFREAVALSIEGELSVQPVVNSRQVRSAVRSLKDVLPDSYWRDEKVNTPYGNHFIEESEKIHYVTLHDAIFSNFLVVNHGTSPGRTELQIRFTEDERFTKIRSNTLLYYADKSALVEYLKPRVKFEKKIVVYQVKGLTE